MSGPTYSVGVSTVTVTYGSSIAATSFGGGIADGLSTTSTPPSTRSTRYSTFGAVATSDEVVLALEPLAHDLHVQQSEEAAAEPEAERARRLGLVGERRVVEPEPLERLAQVGVLVAVDRVEAAEHHRLRVAVALERAAGRAAVVTVSPTRAWPTSLMPAMR